jgi:large subunit ribosomal protein L29
MKAHDLRALDDQKLTSMLQEHYQELFNLRFQKVTGRMTNTARPRQVRREIARIKTVMRERELEQIPPVE